MSLQKCLLRYDATHVWYKCEQCSELTPFFLKGRCPSCGSTHIHKMESDEYEALSFWRRPVADAVQGEPIHVIDTEEHTAQLSHKDQRENDMEKITNYGPILIRKGPYKGKIGYYDDTDMDGKLIIYPNVPTYCSGYYKVSQSAATSVIPTACLAERLSDIDHELYKNCSLEHLPAEEEIMLLHERVFCSDMMTARHLRSMQKFQDQNKTEVFISHSSVDLAFSRAIATDLMDAGFSVFLDDWSINIGERIFEKISTGLCESKALIMIISKDYLKSVCCTDEWGAFYGKALHDKSCVIYPIIIDDSVPPALISQIKYLRFNDDEYTSALSTLLRSLRKQFSK